MNGSNKKSNLTRLLPEEHYIAHLLLAKIYPKHPGIIYAANMMVNRNNKQYGWIKRKFSEIHSQTVKGRKFSDESIQKMSISRTGVPKSEEHKKNLALSKLKTLEYKGKQYKGYKDLKDSTGVTRHLYLKFYCNGVDPEPYIGNNTYAMIHEIKTNHPRHAKDHKWYNNGIEEKYFKEKPNDDNWKIGRLSK